jgi:hypothetical protein
MLTEALSSTKKTSPDITRKCDHGKVEIVTIDDMTLARITLQPGWKWSECVDSEKTCQAHHWQYVIGGCLKILHDDGSQMELHAGDFAVIAPGHDAWVVGDEPFVCIDLSPDIHEYMGEGGRFFG